MAHNIAKINGQDAMFCVGDREAAWHHLGQRTDNAATWQDAMRLAQLDWTVEKRDMFCRSLDGNVFKVPDTQAIWRKTQPSVYLGAVGSDYEPIQNAHAFDFCDSLLAAADGAHYESAGALGNGERIWVLARVPGADIRIAGTDDVSNSYLLIATSHDGSMSTIGKLTSVRVVCQNTLSMALSSGASFFKVKHTKNAQARLTEAKRVMQGVAADALDLNKRLNALAKRRMTKDSMVSVLNRLFPASKDENVSTTRRDNIVTKVLELFERNDGNAIPQIRGSALNLLNACTEYTDHFRTARLTDARKGMSIVQARAENALFGTGDKFKGEALVAVMEETESAPVNDIRVPAAGADFNDGDFLKSLGIKG